MQANVLAVLRWYTASKRVYVRRVDGYIAFQNIVAQEKKMKKNTMKKKLLLRLSVGLAIHADSGRYDGRTVVSMRRHGTVKAGVLTGLAEVTAVSTA